MVTKKTILNFCKKSFMVLIAVMLIGSVELSAQNQRISLAYEDANLKTVLDNISDQTNLKFVYTDKINVNAIKLSFNCNKELLSSVLDKIFKPYGISYTIKGKQIILSTLQNAKLNKSNSLKKTSSVVKGQITDDIGELLVGVTVSNINTNKYEASDINGNFSIQANEGDVIKFSSIGMLDYTITVTSKNDYNIVLKPNAIALDNVIVTGYQTFNKYNSTGSVNQLKKEKIELRSSSSLQGVLEGSVPGLTVYNGDYRIRGGSSLNAGTKPLMIVDDFEVETLPENMDLVENITVLKDAAAAAIWGSRAANGVIVITTKKGKKDNLKISYSNNFNVGILPNFSDLRRADSKAVIDFETEAYKKDYYSAAMYQDKSGYSLSMGIIRDRLNNLITDEQMYQRLGDLSNNSNTKQVKEELLRSSFKQSHMLSLSGGGDKVTYFLSGSYIGGNSSYIGDSNDAFNVNSRLSYQPYKFLTLRTDINANFVNSDNGYTSIESDIISLAPYQMLKDNNGNLVRDYTSFNKESNDILTKLGYYDYGKNIINELNLANNKQESNTYKVRVGADIEIIKGLKASADYQYEKVEQSSKNIRSKDSEFGSNLINRLTSLDANNKLIYNLPNGDVADFFNSTTKSWVFKASLSFSRYIDNAKKHYVNAVAGFEARQRVMEYNKNRKLGYNDQLLSWQPIDQVLLSKTGVNGYFGQERYYASSYDSFGYGDNRETSTFGSAIYTYDNRYTFSGTLRFDESNLFGADKKFRRNPIWSVGGNWNIAKEHFFSSKIISDFIFRATYGYTGNFDRSGSTTPVMVGRRMYLSSVNGYVTRIQTPPNPLLRWEKTRSVNIGVDLSLKDRVNFAIDYYNKYSTDLLGNKQMDPTVGFTEAKVNAASMKNYGLELSVTADILRIRDFTWNASFVFAYNKNEVVSNKISDSSPLINRPMGYGGFVEGYSREALWSYKWAGLDPKTGDPLTYNQAGEKVKALDFSSLVCSGTYQPKYSGSLNTGFSYKGIQLNFMFVYNFGHKFRMEYPTMSPWSMTGSYNELVDLRWRKEGDETDIPSIWTPDWANYLQDRDKMAQYSENSIRDAGFVRLREILLNYELPRNIIKKTPFKRVGVTVKANNVALWTKNKEGIDPEFINPINGTTSLSTPTTFTFGVKLDF